MRYLPAVAAAFIGVVLVVAGFAGMLGCLCDNCSCNPAPGKRLAVAGLVVLLGAIVGAVWMWYRGRAGRRDS
jgi:hypothetical protein